MIFLKRKTWDYPNIEVKQLGSGYPVVMIHGLNSSSDCWKPLIKHLGRRYCFHLVRIKGFDHIPAPDSPSLAGVKNDIDSHIAARALNQPLVIGHSMGGMLALWLASGTSQRLGPLIIIDSLPFMGAALNPFLNAFTNYHYAKWLEHKIISMKSDKEWELFQLKYLNMMVTQKKNIQLALKWAMGADRMMAAAGVHGLFAIDLRHTIRNIMNPTLVLATWKGYEPYGFNRSQIEKIFAQQFQMLPNKEILMADAAKHYIMLDDPRYMNKEIDRFLTPFVRKTLFGMEFNLVDDLALEGNV